MSFPSTLSERICGAGPYRPAGPERSRGGVKNGTRVGSGQSAHCESTAMMTGLTRGTESMRKLTSCVGMYEDKMECCIVQIASVPRKYVCVIPKTLFMKAAGNKYIEQYNCNFTERDPYICMNKT